MRVWLQVDDLVDVIEGNRLYVPCLYILNKIDQITLEELEVIDRMENYVPICAYHEWNLDGVLEAVWDKLDLTRCAPAAALSSAGSPIMGVCPITPWQCEFCNDLGHWATAWQSTGANYQALNQQ